MQWHTNVITDDRAEPVKDVHKSLPDALQFTGRSTRAKSEAEDATVVTNNANDDVHTSACQLYAVSSDWNIPLREFSLGAPGKKSAIQLRREFQCPARVDLPPKLNALDEHHFYQTTCSE